jgi:Zn-dependent hydrolases, including glyoxylases
MKKTHKIILMGTLIAVLLIAAVGLIYVFPMMSMTPSETGDIPDTGIFAVNNQLNCLYFIETNDGYIVIDAGSNAKAVEQALIEKNISPSDVKYVLLTHSDSDHVASLPLFTNAQIYMSEDELRMVDGTIKRNIFGIFNSLPDDIKPSNLSLLKEGEQMNLGEHTIECIKVPGHTVGSMAYLLDGQYLFTGDAFKVKNNMMSIHPYTMDTKTAEESIQNLSELKTENILVITAHYGYYNASDLKHNI